MSTRLRLRRIVLEVLDDPQIEFADTLSPANCSAWDSVAMVQIMLAVEQEFGVRFKTNDIAEVRSIADLMKLLAQQGHESDA